ncbi:hypothetical protein CB1_000743142 [Camelus ferus]|nr:hypothetical protein CB1_000743142 [Camelus ferus]
MQLTFDLLVFTVFILYEAEGPWLSCRGRCGRRVCSSAAAARPAEPPGGWFPEGLRGAGSSLTHAEDGAEVHEVEAMLVLGTL